MLKERKFVDAQKMREQHPETFEAPTYEALRDLKIGDYVKVCCEPERFWCIVKKIENDTVFAEVNNDLVFSNIHNLKDQDLIFFSKRCIYIIESPNE